MEVKQLGHTPHPYWMVAQQAAALLAKPQNWPLIFQFCNEDVFVLLCVRMVKLYKTKTIDKMFSHKSLAPYSQVIYELELLCEF